MVFNNTDNIFLFSLYNTLVYNENKNIFSVLLNTINYVWILVYWTLSLFTPSLRYRRPGYLISRNFRIFVFELYILTFILNHENVTVIVINKFNHYHPIQFPIAFIYTMYKSWLISWMCPQEKRSPINIWSFCRQCEVGISGILL